jgi:syntaxin-binding protein 5
VVVGGPDRPLSKSQATVQYAQDRQRALAERAAKRSNTESSQNSSSSTQGIFAQMSQSLSERGVKLDGVQERFNQLEEASSEWFNSMTKAVETQKRKALIGGITGKLNPF